MTKTTFVALGFLLGLPTFGHAASGDANGDGAVTIVDGVQILRAAAGGASGSSDGAAALRRSAGLVGPPVARAAASVAPAAVPVHFVFASGVGLEGFHVEVTYPLAKGGFAGSADGVACSTSGGGGFFIANDRDDGTMALLQASAFALEFPIVITCLYEEAAGETLVDADLGLAIVDVVLNGASADPSLLTATLAVDELPVCSTGWIRLTTEDGGVLDAGWTGMAHGSPLPAASGMSLPLACAPGESTCEVDGARVVGAAVGAPLPISTGGVSMCVLNSVRDAITGTFDCEGGCADLTVPLLARVFLVVDPSKPCPPCVGDDVPNDGVRGGICIDGTTPGAPCDAAGTVDRFDAAEPGFGTSSYDCLPTGSSVGDLAVDLAPLTSGPTALTADLDCLSTEFPPGSCHCPAQVMPHSCLNGTCPASGVCENGPIDGVCGSEPFRPCRPGTGTEDCEDIFPGAGTCVESPRPCFPSTITRSGSCGESGTTLAAVTCVPNTTAPAINTVYGLPGPMALTQPIRIAAGPAPTVTIPGPSPEPSPFPTPGAPGCAAAPRSECRRVLQPNKAALTLEEGRTGIDELTWRWLGGEATPPFAFGVPIFFTEYALCAYGDAPEGGLVLETRVGPDFSCRGGFRECWRPTAKGGWTYTNPRANAAGVTHVELVPGPNGAARVVFKARSALLDLPSLPLAPPLTVQLQSNEGQCWETRFEPEDVRKNDGRRFRAVARP